MTAPRSRNRAFGGPPARQRGIAMLVAILLVALGTIIAAAVAYDSAMTARRGAATLSFDDAAVSAANTRNDPIMAATPA